VIPPVRKLALVEDGAGVVGKQTLPTNDRIRNLIKDFVDK
jgi:hypothetical protein